MVALAFKLTATGGREDGKSLVDLDAIKRAMAFLPDPTAGVQIQGLPLANHITCPGDNPEAIAKAALELAPNNRGVYWTLNPCPRDMAGAMNSSAALRRRWLLIDIDPRRPADTNSTEAEHDAAKQCISRIRDFLSSIGWPLPVVIDSGNGWHLLYRVDLPNDDASRVLLRETLKILGDTFEDEKVELDRKVHDARRISKIPGILNRKGPSTPERPHRFSRLVFVPDRIEIVTAQQLKEFVGQIDRPQDKEPVHPSVWKVNAGTDRKRAYARNVLEREEARVVLASVGDRNNCLNLAAFSLGTLIGAGAILQQEAEERLAYAAQRNGLEEAETRNTIKSGIEAGKAKPRDLGFLEEPTRNGKHGGHPPTSGGNDAEDLELTINEQPVWKGNAGDLKPDIEHRHEKKRFQVFSMGHLRKIEFPPARWVIPGILSEGLNMLAGGPKQGKSMLALNLALTVGGGGYALGNVQVVQGDVLYISLEDKDRRVKDRAIKMAGVLDERFQADSHLYVVTTWPQQHHGGLALIGKWLDSVERPSLVIIDTWGKFRPDVSERANAFQQDYRQLGDLKEYLDQKQVSSIVIHHTRKMASEDAVENVSGTQGLTAVPDGLMVLKRARNDTEAELYVTGRDGGEQKLALQFSPETLTWRSLGKAEDHLQGKLQLAVLAYLKQLNGETTFTADIAAHVNQEPNKIRPVLHRLFDKKIIRKVGNAWAYPAEPAPVSGRDDDRREF